MIITRSPLRISLGGGGTDLPSYSRDFGGFVISAAIDKHVYLTIHEPFTGQILLKYSQMEVVGSRSEIRHPVIREALGMVGIESQIEIASMSDIPSGTGLGSSGSFATALLKGLHTLQRNYAPPKLVAEQACHIEMELLREPVGVQDPYIAAFGGVTAFTIDRSGEVHPEALRLDPETLHNLEDNLLLFFTGFTRSASDILRDQDTRTRQDDQEMIDNLHRVKQIGLDSRKMLEQGNLRCFAELMHTHWENKRMRSPNMTNSVIDQYYEFARANGALGGKVIGAGGGGFLMLYSEEKTRLRRAMTSCGLREVRIRFDFEGSKVVAQS